MAGGQRIDDHKAWMGGHGHGSVLPDGPHKVKMESSAMGAGHESEYEDTTEKIKAQQEMGVRKVKGHPHKPSTRN